jgi:hypothetical protein
MSASKRAPSAVTSDETPEAKVAKLVSEPESNGVVTAKPKQDIVVINNYEDDDEDIESSEEEEEEEEESAGDESSELSSDDSEPDNLSFYRKNGDWDVGKKGSAKRRTLRLKAALGPQYDQDCDNSEYEDEHRTDLYGDPPTPKLPPGYKAPVDDDDDEEEEEGDSDEEEEEEVVEEGDDD